MGKYALLIGVSQYQAEGLRPLPSAERDGEAMQRILQHPEMGGFPAEQVVRLTNPTKGQVEDAIYTLFAGKQKDDLLLFYFSGHGIKDETGKLYFSLPETQKNQGSLVKHTAIAATTLHDNMTESRSQSQVLVLDCCFSGAFAKGLTIKDDGGVDVRSQLGGRGRAIFTASTSTQYSFQQDDFPLSVYTQFFVEGIEKGTADRDEDGFISADELHQYVLEKVQSVSPAMTPQFYPVEQGHRIYLAKSPKDDPVLKFRKEVERWVKQGAFNGERDRFSVAARNLLDEQRQRLGLTVEVTEAITDEVLQPIREYQRKLQRYRQTVIDTLEDEGYPFDATTQNVLKELQLVLGLRDGDVGAIVTPLVRDWQAKQVREGGRSVEVTPPIQTLRSVPTPTPVPPRPTPAPVVTPASQPTSVQLRSTPQTTAAKPLIDGLSDRKRRQILKWLGYGGGGLALPWFVKWMLDNSTETQRLIDNFKGTQRPQPIQLSSVTLKDFDFEIATVNAQGKEAPRKKGAAKAFVEDLGNGVTLEMVVIPGGTFRMGSPENEKERGNDESPQRTVTVPSFLMGRYAVTQRQYEAIANKNPSGFKGANRPVEKVTWNDAQAFCGTLSEKTGRNYRLPSEAEWEYACRAGTTTPFHFGETLTSKLANYNASIVYQSEPEGEYRQQTTDVGSFPANALGLCDMHGNVWEWCEDVYHSNYQGAPTNGSAWNEGGEQGRRILRGGSWNSFPGNCRSANRDGFSSDYLYTNFGFRVVAVLA
ncbi:MAG: SUMF1/EgtB/PvdO family nonheme iron enzyme [Oculatellaceae cyanobacterium Prado106]|nr:SUMF1/EgtB/PvdO family nonheme iron enzyme [Oculatellaceae cyanobacterium Prado106]